LKRLSVGGVIRLAGASSNRDGLGESSFPRGGISLRDVSVAGGGGVRGNSSSTLDLGGVCYWERGAGLDFAVGSQSVGFVDSGNNGADFSFGGGVDDWNLGFDRFVGSRGIDGWDIGLNGLVANNGGREGRFLSGVNCRWDCSVPD